MSTVTCSLIIDFAPAPFAKYQLSELVVSYGQTFEWVSYFDHKGELYRATLDRYYHYESLNIPVFYHDLIKHKKGKIK